MTVDDIQDIKRGLYEFGIDVSIMTESIDDENGTPVGTRLSGFHLYMDWDNPFDDREFSFPVGERYLRFLQRRRDRLCALDTDALVDAYRALRP